MELKPARILALETSCDETACAIIENGRALLSSVVASQMEIHARYGGVYPEVASRQHVLSVTPVVEQALSQAHLTLNDIDLIELNEAFAVQALAVMKESGLNPDIVNVNGGAIALGHPLGCTGAKLSIQIINELKRRNQRYGMVTACVGGGQGIAGIIERLD